ncbi:MAG: hypothetical protein NTV79_00430 [Candidatus Aureabacteria bacterium]|nr:hypothetical protein [Candidatus Auribacterota bacterium]
MQPHLPPAVKFGCGRRAAWVILAVLLSAAGNAAAYNVDLEYYVDSPYGLADEFRVLLEQYDMVQLIYAGPDGVINPPNIYNGMPQGDDVLWEGFGIDAGGTFYRLFEHYDSSLLGDYVYIRFFNADVMGQVTFYGLSPLHQLSEDFFGLDIWDVTEGGLYLWTEYPFIVIPEPETWLTLLPALAAGIFVYKKRKSNKKAVTQKEVNSNQ